MRTLQRSIRRVAAVGLVASTFVGTNATTVLAQIIHVDPTTGARSAPSAAGVTAMPPDPAFSTSHAGLVEEPAPGGGMTVSLQGRFRSAAVATVDPDGKAKVECVEPGSGEKE